MIIIRNLRYYFFVGLFSIIPIGVIFFLIKWILELFISPAQSIISKIVFIRHESFIWIIAFVLTVSFILFCGYLISSVFGRFLFLEIEKIISQIPVVNTLYQTVKSITDSISNKNKQAFSKVVLIQYPRKGIWTIALVTGQSENEDGKKFYHLYLPTTPNPTSGFMLYVPMEDAIETDMGSEEAIKIIISGGTLSPDKNQIK